MKLIKIKEGVICNLPNTQTLHTKYLINYTWYTQTLIQQTSSSDPFCSLYRIIHCIKCNMLVNPQKQELGLVHYIRKFTISRFVISRFECMVLLTCYRDNTRYIYFTWPFIGQSSTTIKEIPSITLAVNNVIRNLKLMEK